MIPKLVAIRDERIAQALQTLLKADATSAEVYGRKYYDKGYIPDEYDLESEYYDMLFRKEVEEELFEADECMRDKSNPRWRECWRRYYALIEQLREWEERKYMRELEEEERYVGYRVDEDEEDEYYYGESAWDGEEIYVIPGDTTLLIDVEKRYGDVIVDVSAIDGGVAFNVLTIKREQGKWLVEVAGETVELERDALIVLSGRGAVPAKNVVKKICDLVKDSELYHDLELC
jgi:hypothetical protein